MSTLELDKTSRLPDFQTAVNDEKPVVFAGLVPSNFVEPVNEKELPDLLKSHLQKLRNRSLSNLHLNQIAQGNYGLNPKGTHVRVNIVRPQLISSDNSYQFEKATTHIER